MQKKNLFRYTNVYVLKQLNQILPSSLWLYSVKVLEQIAKLFLPWMVQAVPSSPISTTKPEV